MMKKHKQLGFYMIETLISVQLFFVSILTMLPIQHQILLEMKVLKEKDKVAYFLDEKIQEALVITPVEQEHIYEDVIPHPITITFTNTDTLLKGCVTWINAKQNDDKVCFYVNQE